MAVLSLVFYNDPIVKEYFARLNGTLEPVTVAPSTPASLPEVKPAPMMEVLPPPASDAPIIEEIPAKSKRAPRKMAKK